VSHTGQTAVLARLDEVRRRLDDALPRVDPHHRLAGRPVSYRVIDGATLEILWRDVPSIADAELLAVKRLIGGESACTVSPQTAETVIVRVVVVVATASEGAR
jgi:hypothetical protein